MVPSSWKVRALAVAGLLTVLGFASSAPAQSLGGSTDGGGISVGGGGGGSGGGGGGSGGGDDGGGGGTENPRPVIGTLNVLQLPGRKFRISGRVLDDTPGTCGVVITGAANGVAMCDANGNFDAIYDVPTPGDITAEPGDGTQSGDTVYVALANDSPSVSVMAVQGPGNTWTFSGTVGDESPEGLTVSLTGPAGVNGATATVGADGSWSVTVTVGPGVSGFVTATCTDWYSETGSGMTYFSP